MAGKQPAPLTRIALITAACSVAAQIASPMSGWSGKPTIWQGIMLAATLLFASMAVIVGSVEPTPLRKKR